MQAVFTHPREGYKLRAVTAYPNLLLEGALLLTVRVCLFFGVDT